MGIKQRSQGFFWLAALILAIFSVIGWMRFQQTLRHWYYLVDLGIWPHPVYLAVSGGLIGIGFGLALIFHLSRSRFTLFAIRILEIVLLIWLWIDRIFIGMRESFLLLLAGTVMITLIVIACDRFIFRRNSYVQKAEQDA